MAPYPFQIEAATAIEQGATLLAARPGAGKTCISVVAARRANARLVFVACPAIAQGVWLGEVGRWWPEAAAIRLKSLIAGEKLPDRPTFIISSYDFLVANHHARQKVAELGELDLGVADESHFLKSPTAQRTRLMFGPRCEGDGLLARCRKVILLTGTPVVNHVGELYPALRALAPERIEERTYGSFTGRYCVLEQRRIKTRGGSPKVIERIAGSKQTMLPELAGRLKGFWHRPPKSEVEAQLPPLRLVVRHLSPDAVNAAAICELDRSEEAQILRAAIERGDLRSVEGHLARLRRLMAAAKVEATASWVEHALEDEGEPKVLLWGWHVAALQALHRRLARGGTTRSSSPALRATVRPPWRPSSTIRSAGSSSARSRRLALASR